jgi:hypothetical protein
MGKQELRQMANDFLLQASDADDEYDDDPNEVKCHNACKFYALAWGAYRHLKDGEMMAHAREGLERFVGDDWDELHRLQWKGYHKIRDFIKESEK